MMLEYGITAVASVAVTTVILLVFQQIRRNSARSSAEKIRSDAEKDAEHLLRDARVSAKSETIRMREECEAELKERRREQKRINDIMLDPFYASEVGSGNMRFSRVEWEESMLTDADITEVEVIDFSLRVYDSESYDEMFVQDCQFRP